MTMPWNNRDYFHLGFLIFCLPLQYYLSNYNSSKVDISEIKNYVNFTGIKGLSLPSLSYWIHLCKSYIYWLTTSVISDVPESVDESPAVEVFEYRKKHGLQYQRPSIIQLNRPEGLWFRVGQVVEHLIEGYKGVIIEWEFDAKESSVPIYKILVDEKSKVHIDFNVILEVEQDDLYLLKNTQIDNRFLKNYFVAFDGTQYIPQPWLKELYPKD